MHNIEELRLLPVWVDPQHLVATARHVMAGHRMRVLSVVEDGNLVGTVSLERIAGAPDEAQVRAFIDPLGVVIEAGTPIRKVADRFVKEHVEYAPVVSGDRFLGMATSNLLLRELGHSWDPLTHLPWSDRLREWGVDSLSQGREICILFVDLDEFGLYNKRYGHIVGDRVLARVARVLKECVDPRTDLLVRFGGDEFAIGTSRPGAEAQQLVETLKARMGEASVAEAAEPVTFSVGIRGGKRTKEREHVHFAATLDNLINLASQDCLANKPKPSAVESDGSPVSAEDGALMRARPSVVGVYTDERSPNALTTVFLKMGTSVVSGMDHRAGRDPLETIARATAKALERVFPGEVLTVDRVETSGDDGERIVTVSGKVVSEDGERAAEASAKVETDAFSAAAQATIEAVAGGCR